jgi:hypothetical protein
MPRYRTPRTQAISTTKGIILINTPKRCFQEYLSSSPMVCEVSPLSPALLVCCWEYPLALLRNTATRIHKQKSNVTMMPGTTPPRNRRPIDVSVAMPYRIKVTLGGISIPSVPPATIAPVASPFG